MKILDMIPGVSQVKLAIFAVSGIALIAAGIWAYNYVDGLKTARDNYKASFETQLTENGKLVASLDQAVKTANEASALLKTSIEDLKASDARAEDYRRQRDLFWRKVNGIDLSKSEDGPLAPGVLDGLMQLCAIEGSSGRTCSAFDRETGSVHAPDQPGEPAVRRN